MSDHSLLVMHQCFILIPIRATLFVVSFFTHFRIFISCIHNSLVIFLYFVLIAWNTVFLVRLIFHQFRRCEDLISFSLFYYFPSFFNLISSLSNFLFISRTLISTFSHHCFYFIYGLSSNYPYFEAVIYIDFYYNI